MKAKLNIQCGVRIHFEWPGSGFTCEVTSRHPSSEYSGSKSALGMLTRYQWLITWGCVRHLPSATPSIVWHKHFLSCDIWRLTRWCDKNTFASLSNSYGSIGIVLLSNVSTEYNTRRQVRMERANMRMSLLPFLIKSFLAFLWTIQSYHMKGRCNKS